MAPSSLGEDTGSDPPLPTEHALLAAKRGVLIHALLERLPDVALIDRDRLATDWLARNASEFDESSRDEMRDQALRVLDDPAFAEVFAPGSFAETPLAATVGGQVISGTIDRLLITEEALSIVDFKTSRRPPTSIDAIPESIIKQMAAYSSALEAIYPGRLVRAGVLFTQTPQLFELPQELIRLHKNVFVAG